MPAAATRAPGWRNNDAMLERTIGLISDTHGLLRPEAVAALRGCAHLVHAGDVGRPDVVEALQAMAPLTVVRGNNDGSSAAPRSAAGRRAPSVDATAAPIWPETALVDVLGTRLFVLHELSKLGAAPAGTRVVVYGHSHKPSIDWRDGLLYLNPGSAGPRRFSLPVTVARLHVSARGGLEPEFVQLL